MTGYTLGVVFGAPLLTVLGTKVSRKKMLLSLMFMGLTVANIVGVPLGTNIGQDAG